VEIAKYVCFLLGLWAVVAGLFGALLSISVQMRRYKYRSLPQKFIGQWRYDSSNSAKVYPTDSATLMPWIAAECGLTTTSNANSFVQSDVTLFPTCVPTVSDLNVVGYPVVATCGTPCQNDRDKNLRTPPPSPPPPYVSPPIPDR